MLIVTSELVGNGYRTAFGISSWEKNSSRRFNAVAASEKLFMANGAMSNGYLSVLNTETIVNPKTASIEMPLTSQ